MPKVSLEIGVFEDIANPGYVSDADIERAWATPAMLTWWKEALSRLEQTPEFTQARLNDDLVKQGHCGGDITITLMLCGRNSLSNIMGSDRALGCHLITTPDGDPFNEEANSSGAYRVLMVSEMSEFLRLAADLAAGDVNPAAHMQEYIESWLNTAFHEIAHAVLFAQNAAHLTPDEIENLSDAGEIDHDLFDCSTGYGIRALAVDGVEIWSDTIEEARDDMEAYVEARGREMMVSVLHGDLDPMTFLAAAGIEDVYANAIGHVDHMDDPSP